MEQQRLENAKIARKRAENEKLYFNCEQDESFRLRTWGFIEWGDRR